MVVHEEEVAQGCRRAEIPLTSDDHSIVMRLRIQCSLEMPEESDYLALCYEIREFEYR